MKNVFDAIKLHVWKILTIIFFLLFLAKGCTNKKISKLDKKYDLLTNEIMQRLDSLYTTSNQKATKQEVKQQMEQVMFNYLIYEDDLDRGKISLSDIKNKLEE